MSLLLERQLIIFGEQDGRHESRRVLEFFKPRTTMRYKRPIRDEIEFDRSNVARLPFQLSAICITVCACIFNAPAMLSYIGGDQGRLISRNSPRLQRWTFEIFLTISDNNSRKLLKGKRKRSFVNNHDERAKVDIFLLVSSCYFYYFFLIVNYII